MKLTHDGSFDIATGRNRKETNWRNKEMLWSELITKLSITHTTAETHAEYMAAKKPRQDEIKDVGGFVGGFLTGGRRKASNVLHRQLLTLDIDFGNLSFWEDLTLLYGNAAVLYSTHKHSPENPRLRLIMPLDRPVRPDEYEAIARRVAGVLNIEVFDPTTFQPERLMYWPSTSKDAVYEFQMQDGVWLNADEVLATYRDWQDSSEWPVSSRVDKILLRSMQKQGDPLEKTGVVGAFCKTYSIHEAIEAYLADVYETCDVDNRYTYKEGSTAAGLVVYEDKYAYSHHGTDPTSGKLCNAFDLVRIHKFGLQDEGVSDMNRGNKRPSFDAMVDYVSTDTRVKKMIALEKIAGAKNDFIDVDNSEDETDYIEDSSDWMAELDADKRSNYLTNVLNLQTILQKDVKLKNKIAFNEFSRKPNVLKPLPWDKKKGLEIREWEDDDLDNLRCYLGLPPYNLKRTPMLEDALTVIKRANSFHPVRDYLNGVKWDGVDRIETLFIDYLGAANTDYVKAVSRKTLIAAVNRVFEPGCKFDNVLTLVGKEGAGKSTLIKKLGMDWYTDTFNFGMLNSGNGIRAFEQIQGKWLVEIGEMVGLKKTDVEAAKNFLSSCSDDYRASHKMETLNRKRQCVFFGTTNSFEFLKSANGNRRFWPVDVLESIPVKSVWDDLNQLEVDQIWAEAVTLFNAGEGLNLSKELEQIAKEIQEDHVEHDERKGMIEAYLKTLLPTNWDDLNIYEKRAFLQGDEAQEKGTIARTKVCVAEIWCEVLGGQQKEMTTHNTKFIHDILSKLEGWERSKSKRKFPIYGVQNAYEQIATITTNNHKNFNSGYRLN